MRIILKILLLPIRMVLGIITLFLQFILGLGTAILNIFSVLFFVVAIWSFIKGQVPIGIEGLVLSFLFSPYGIPMIGAVVIGFIAGINELLGTV